MNSLTIKVYINGANANQGKLILNNVEYPFDNVMPGSDNDYEYYFYFDNPITLPVTGQLFITNPSDDIVPFDHNGTIQVNQGYGIWNYDSNNPCYMEFELEQDGQAYGDPSIEFGSVSNPWYYNQYVVSSCNTPTTYTITTSVTGQGTISGINNPYTSGDTATVTATANSGSCFVYFKNGRNISTNDILSLTVDADITLEAGFSEESDPISGNGHWECNVEGDIMTMAFNNTTHEAAILGDSYSYYYIYNDNTIKAVYQDGSMSYTITYNSSNNTIDLMGYIFTWVSDEPQPEKHIYLCDNSGAHLAEMTNTGSTWNVTGAFTSGMYSIRATVEGEYDDAWFKFYQTSGDNRVFVGAGDDPSFEDIGTYILIDNILTSFSLTEDQETDYYVVNYQNTDAMTVSTVENIVNTYVGEMGFVTGSDIAEMSYITMTDVQSLGYIDQTALSSMSYITMTDISSLGYVSGSELVSMAYVDQTSLSNMSYIDNSYLSTYMNNVVGDINSILQTI